MRQTEFMGVHTCMPGLIKNWEEYKVHFEQYPLVYANDGHLPPFIVSCGSRTRVAGFSELLDNFCQIDKVLLEAGKPIGRVAVAVGTYKGTPIAVFEHQMGCPATEINFREISSPYVVKHVNYVNVDCTNITTDAVYSIRVGTCGGMNLWENENPEGYRPVDLAHIVVSTHHVGVNGTLIQSATGHLDLMSPTTLEVLKTRLRELGYDMSKPMPVLYDDNVIVDSFRAVANEEYTHFLGYFSKDSLYAELEEEAFVDLRRDYDCACSEMEAAMIAYQSLCRRNTELPVVFSAVCAVIGTVPGSSFSDDPATLSLASNRACVTGLDALNHLQINKF
ncbi:hypothetical protein PCE1_000744 [Barthelona sp. PCE]